MPTGSGPCPADTAGRNPSSWRGTNVPTARSAVPLQRRLQVGPHVVGDDGVAARGGVDSVGLVEGGIAGNACEQERHEGDAGTRSDLGKRVVEPARVVVAVV